VGITRLELQVFANNARAIALYERMGFQVEGRRRMAVMVDGVAIDVLMMATLVASDS
jgi:putative acetyltransferase